MQHVTYQRQIVLDTETTGLNPKEGHRILEIAGVELINRRITRHDFHVYINPQRAIDAEASAVHGITQEFLKDKPLFAQIAQEFMAFIQGAELLIHNAPFDIGFLNHELSLLGSQDTIEKNCTVFDTLTLAKTKHPGQRNSLDALCKRYNIDNSQRNLHGALLDAQLLAEVYLAMTGGQESLLGEENKTNRVDNNPTLKPLLRNRGRLKVLYANETELEEHQQRLAAIDKASKGNCLWLASSQ